MGGYLLMVIKELSIIDTDIYRSNLLIYTRKAFQMLPKIENPYILDIGCGSGVPTMELAKLSNGRILGLDIDQAQLNKLEQKIRKAELSKRIHIMRCSMLEMQFKDESFDVIWAEGSISAIGFKNGLQKFRLLIKPSGFLVVHDQLKDLNEKLGQIPDCGYKLLGYFILSKEVWWTEYYLPMKKHLNDIITKHTCEPECLQELGKLQQEIDGFSENPESNQSVFFVMQKI
jgi:ubiquinone/menaquinone biosynthesis C-methylase UbiE